MGYENVLFIGPNYKGHKGGIGAVLDVYAKNVQPFNFIASYDGNYNAVFNACLFVLCLFRVSVKLLLNRKILVVHIHGSSNGSFYRKYLLFLWVKYIFGKKVVYHMHGGGFGRFYSRSGPLLKGLITHFVNKSDALVCLSKSWQEYFSQHFNPKAVIIINNPIERVDGIKLEKIDRVEFLFLGKISEQKGVFDLLHIIEQNKTAFRDKAVFKFGGNGETDRLAKYVVQHQLEELVFFEGWVTGSHKHALLSSAHVYILPSYAEGLPISILEAMNYGLPVISTHVGGIPEIVFNQINGFLVAPGDLAAIKQAIVYYMQHPCDILRMGHKSKSLCSAFDIQSILPNLDTLYKQVLKTPG